MKDRYKFGICAMIEPSELDMIMERYPEPVQCLSNIVDRWNRTSYTRSWSVLAKVVEKMQNYEQLALSLRRMAGKDEEWEKASHGDSDTHPEPKDSQTHIKKCDAVKNPQLMSIKDSRKSKSLLPHSFLRFKCAGGECTIHDHFEGKKCDNHSKRYPYLEVRGEPYETDIEIYLEEQSDKMRDSFANLMYDTIKQLQESVSVPFSDIRGYVKLLAAGKAGYDRIKNAEDLHELQDALIETCCSWFNHGIIAKLRKAFLHKNSDDQILKEYTADFEIYCKRRCFESPADLHPEIDSSSNMIMKALVFKVEQDFHTSTLTDILLVKRAVAKILGCPPHAINVCSVKEGCTEVHCQVLPIADISRISDQQLAQLSQQDIISFKVEGVELMRVSQSVYEVIYSIITILNHNKQVKKDDGEIDTCTTETVSSKLHSPS